MKNIKRIFSFVLLVAIFMSCAKETENNTVLPEMKFETVFAKVSNDGMVNFTNVFDTKTKLVEADLYSVVSFNKNGTFSIDNENLGSWSLNGNEIAISVKSGESYTGIIKENMLYVTMHNISDEITTSIEMHYQKK
ncbi:MAG: hypothetical protein ABFR62_07590 [Bacteroidota bacterium]